MTTQAVLIVLVMVSQGPDKKSMLGEDKGPSRPVVTATAHKVPPSRIRRTPLWDPRSPTAERDSMYWSRYYRGLPRHYRPATERSLGSPITLSPESWRHPEVRPPECTPSRQRILVGVPGAGNGRIPGGEVKMYVDDDGILVVPPRGVTILPGEPGFMERYFIKGR